MEDEDKLAGGVLPCDPLGSSGPGFTWARCSRFSSSCLACLRAAFCTRRVSLAFSSSSVYVLGWREGERFPESDAAGLRGWTLVAGAWTALPQVAECPQSGRWARVRADSQAAIWPELCWHWSLLEP